MNPLSTDRIPVILDSIKKVKIAVYGDFCLDAYWILDPAGSEVSLETGIRADAVKKHYYSPGGASNIVSNLAALQPARIRVIGIIGNDLFGRELESQLKCMGVDTSGLYVQKEHFDTYTFNKRFLNDEEGVRTDFGFFNARSGEADDFVLREMEKALEEFEILIFNQQVPGSITHDSFIQRSNQLFGKFQNKKVLLDSRHYNERFRNVMLKTNEKEIARLSGAVVKREDFFPLKRIKEYGKIIFARLNKPVFVTCGERGMLVFDDQGITEINGIQLLKRLDTVGAGDTVMSALALCLAAGYLPAEAAVFANYAAAVTVQKLFITGTASGGEILQVAADPDWIFHPDLASNPKQAHYLSGTQIEICDDLDKNRPYHVKHALFDHDGTLSLLRTGWEEVMQKVMFRAITGDHPVDNNLRKVIQATVLDFIEKSTGIQTLLQMESLVDMVHEFDLAPREKRLDKFGYKKIYLHELHDAIRHRQESIGNKTLPADKFIVPGSIDLLTALKKKGVKLYLASGTDQEFVIREAELLGYASLFDGGIYGAVDDTSKFSKKILIEKIISSHHLHGDQLIVFGDGPVEIREGGKKGSLRVGVASDENKIGVMDIKKRKRLVQAGAQVIIPDFSEWEKLIEIFFK